mmetsp:Transcript_8231/g.20435  ORF Transcript_8231/g.20435 Transcript_8231/m.20435 type:complete len:356 (-) Transcript_8231:271-1338(-)
MLLPSLLDTAISPSCPGFTHGCVSPLVPTQCTSPHSSKSRSCVSSSAVPAASFAWSFLTKARSARSLSCHCGSTLRERRSSSMLTVARGSILRAFPLRSSSSSSPGARRRCTRSGRLSNSSELPVPGSVWEYTGSLSTDARMACNFRARMMAGASGESPPAHSPHVRSAARRTRRRATRGSRSASDACPLSCASRKTRSASTTPAISSSNGETASSSSRNRTSPATASRCSDSVGSRPLTPGRNSRTTASAAARSSPTVPAGVHARSWRVCSTIARARSTSSDGVAVGEAGAPAARASTWEMTPWRSMRGKKCAASFDMASRTIPRASSRMVLSCSEASSVARRSTSTCENSLAQ